MSAPGHELNDRQGRGSRAIGSLGSILSSGVAAMVPLAMLSAGASSYGVGESAELAIALSISAYFAQLAVAALVECPMLGRAGIRVGLPAFVYSAGIAGVVLWVLGGLYLPIAFIGLLLMMPSLECTRATAVLRPNPRRETAVALVIGAGVACALTVPSRWVLHLVLGAVVAFGILARLPGGVGTREVIRGDQWWVLAETGTVGIVQPFAVSLAYTFLGPTATTTLKFTLSVANLVSPVLYFVRLRLLRQRSAFDAMFAGILFLVGFGATIGLQESGVFLSVFGEGWASVTVGCLSMGFLWKLLSLLTTFPFATLRRRGRGRLVFGLRVVSTVAFMLSILISVGISGTVVGVLAGYVGAEAVSCILFLVCAGRVEKEGGGEVGNRF